jgi:hypothetical protein
MEAVPAPAGAPQGTNPRLADVPADINNQVDQAFARLEAGQGPEQPGFAASVAVGPDAPAPGGGVKPAWGLQDTEVRTPADATTQEVTPGGMKVTSWDPAAPPPGEKLPMAYHEKMNVTGVPGAQPGTPGALKVYETPGQFTSTPADLPPGGGVEVPGNAAELRPHSPNPNAPAGSKSASEWSAQLNEAPPPGQKFNPNLGYYVPAEEGQPGYFKPFGQGTEAEKAAMHMQMYYGEGHMPPGGAPAPGGGGPAPGGGGPAPAGGGPAPSGGGPAPAGGGPAPAGGGPAAGGAPGVAPGTTPAPGDSAPSVPLGAVNAVSLPAVATGAGAGAQAGADATKGKEAGGKAPIVEAVNPNYKSPPGTKEQLARLDKDIEKVLAVRAAAESRQKQADATHGKLQEQKGQITGVQKGVEKGQSATQAHDAMIKRKQEANEQKAAKQKEGEGHTSDAASQLAGIATLETLLSGWAGFTGLVLKFSDVLPGGMVSQFQSMNDDATKFMVSLVKTKSNLEAQKAQQPGQAAQIASDKGAIAATGTQAAATKGQFTQAQTGAAQLSAANAQQTSFVAEKKAKAGQDAAKAGEGADKLTAKKTTLAAQVEAWAQEHKAARMKAIEETVAKVEATGAKVTKKPTG